MYEESTGNKIKVEAVPDDQLTDLIKTCLATSTDVPDICAGNDLYMDDYFVPFDGEWIDKLVATFLEEVYRSDDGNVYRAPYRSATTLGLIYNKKVMEENDIQLPIKSYSAWMDVCEKLQGAGVRQALPVWKKGKEREKTIFFVFFPLCRQGGLFELQLPAYTGFLLMGNSYTQVLPEQYMDIIV